MDLTVRLMYRLDLTLDVSVGDLGNNYFEVYLATGNVCKGFRDMRQSIDAHHEADASHFKLMVIKRALLCPTAHTHLSPLCVLETDAKSPSGK